jgi:hypothetical protein
MDTTESHETYLKEITAWQERLEAALRSENGWLTLTGLYWLEEGENTVGSVDDNAVILPRGAEHLGVITVVGDQLTLRVDSDDVTLDGQPVREGVLRVGSDSAEPAYVRVETVTFFVLERGGRYAVRVRDSQHPARAEFAGRNWFPINADYKVTAAFTPHEAARTLKIVNSVGQNVEMGNPGYVDFRLEGQDIRLEAFEGGEGQLWFIFRDGTSGKLSYGAGRFMYAPLHADNTVMLDFNKAYHPPCAFTEFATCPFPPRENMLTLAIPVGECN